MSADPVTPTPEAIVICGHLDPVADRFCVARKGHPGPHGYTSRAYFEAVAPLRSPAAPGGIQGEAS